MEFRNRILILVALQTASCYTPHLLHGLGGGDVISTSFLPQESGLFLHPFSPRKQWNDSYQESTFVSFPGSRGVLASLGPLHDFAPLSHDNLSKSESSARSSVDFYDMEGHVIRSEVTQDFPFIQVLFHARTISNDMPDNLAGNSRLCIEMVAVKDDDITTSFCQVDELTGVCLTNITVPERWWSNPHSSSSSPSTSSSSSPPPREDLVEISYVAYTQSSKCPRGSLESNLSSLLYSGISRGGGTGQRRFQLEGNFARLPKIQLVSATSDGTSYDLNVRNAEVLVYTPKEPVRPGRRFRVLVKLRPDSQLKKFSIRAKTKLGLRILGIETHPPWQTDLEISARRQVAEVVTFNTQGHHHSEQALAVFDWLLEADLHPLKVTFTMDYTNLADRSDAPDESEPRMTVKVKVVNDAVEKLVPVLENYELINISPITGQPQSFTITIFAVAGDQVSDVTERSSCFSSDEAVLQVSETCGSYYTSGTEKRGSTGVTIKVEFEGQEVIVPLKVWMLETPVQVELSDGKLSLMAGWKVPLFDPNAFSKKDPLRTGTSPRTPLSCQARFQSTTVDVYARLVAHEPSKVSMTTTTTSDAVYDSAGPETNAMLDLRNRSESSNQKPERGSKHHPSKNNNEGGGGGGGGVNGAGNANQEIKMADGHVAYLLHRKASFKVTHLLRSSIRSADHNVVNLDNTRKDGVVVADGVKPGKTEIQVVSHNGNVVGSRDIRVSMDKVTLDHVRGQATSELRLQVGQSQDFPSARIAMLDKVATMSRRYQESPLEILVGFDDDTSLPLRLIHPDDYVINIDSLDNSVVEVDRSAGLEFPKIVAKGSGSGDLVSLALGPSRFCPTPRPRPLATGHVHVDVAIPHDDLLTQNDAGHFFGFPAKDIIELDVEAVRKNSKFEKARQKSGKFSKVEGEAGRSTLRIKSSQQEADRHHQQQHEDVHLEPLPSQYSLSSSSSSVVHVTMYVLLGIFGLALAIFVVNCFFYVANGNNRKSKMTNIFVGKNATIKEVQDWIWIDKKTLERNAVNTKCTRALMSPDEFSRASKASSSNGGECRLSSATDFSSEVSCLSSSAGVIKSGGLYRGSECSVRIGGPVMPPDDNGNTLPHDHHSLKCGGGGSCKQLNCGSKKELHGSLSEQIQVDSDVEMADSFRCIPLDGQTDKATHIVNDNDTDGQQDEQTNAKTSTQTKDETIWKDEKLDMSYEQLMKYFSNLKESDA